MHIALSVTARIDAVNWYLIFTITNVSLINMKIIFQIILENLKGIIKIMQFFIYMFLRFLKISCFKIFRKIVRNHE